MRYGDKQALLELMMEQFDKHWSRTPEASERIYGGLDGYDRRLVKQAINYVLDDHYARSQFDFIDPRYGYGWMDQARLAIISMFLVDQRETFCLDEEMLQRAHHLMTHVRDENVPRSLLRDGASL